MFQEYFGQCLKMPEDLLKTERGSRDDPFEAYSMFGKTNPYETALNVTPADGNLTSDLRFQGVKQRRLMRLER